MKPDLTPKIGITQLTQLLERYDEARADGLCHTGAWEIIYQIVLPLDLMPIELEALENWLMP